MPATGMFAELLAHVGVEEETVLGSTFGFMAYHGGNLEAGTDLIAAEAARRAGASLYAVRQPENLRWHVPSTAFDPSESPVLTEFLDHVEIVVTVHGYGRKGMWTDLLLGGRNRELAGHLAAALGPRLPGYTIRADLATIPKALRGLHPHNPVNRPRGAGVQIELPPRVRGNTPHWQHWPGGWPAPPTESLIGGLAEAASTWRLSGREPDAVGHLGDSDAGHG